MVGTVVFLFGFASVLQLTSVVHASYDKINKLKKTLFENYIPSIRPVVDQTDTVYVNLTLTMALLDNLDLKRQTLTSGGYISAKWYDELLTWNESQYGGCDFIVVPQSQLWLPDYVLNNDVTSRDLLGKFDTLVHISSNGLVVWEPAFVTETSCKVDIRKYPFDEQECYLQILPWMSTSRQLKTNVNNKMLLTDMCLHHGEFLISSNEVRLVNFSTVFNDDVLLAMNLYIHLSRRHTFYWMSMVFPMVAFPLLCPISFLVPVECGEKITLAITVVLSYLVFIASLNEQMPKLSDTVCLLVLYSTIQIAISILTVAVNGVIIYLYNMRPNHNPKDVDRKSNIFKGREGKPQNDCTSAESNSADIGSGDNLQIEKAVNWKAVAHRLDKICFFFFMSATLIVTITVVLFFWCN